MLSLRRDGSRSSNEAESRRQGTEGNELPGSIAEVATFPVIRRATLLGIEPRLSDPDGPKIGDRLANDWTTNPNRRASLVELVAGFEPGKKILVEPAEMPRYIIDAGRTLLFDYPLIFSEPDDSNNHVEVRVCTAICLTGTSTSKAWARVGPSRRVPRSASAVTGNQLAQAAMRFDSLADAVCKWMTDVVEELTSQLGHKVTVAGSADITTLGVSDSRLSSLFWRLQETELPASKLLQKPERRRISDYLGQMGSRQELSAVVQSVDGQWFSTRVYVEVEGGYLEPREVLYFEVGDGPMQKRVFGIGFDDSISGELSHKASFEVARWMGPTF